jgi:hypothetical protein
MMAPRLAAPAVMLLPLTLALAACEGPAPANDSAAADNIADPALTSALQDQIMVDPQLSAQANGDAIRPPSRPASGGVPADDVAANGDGIGGGPLLRAPAPTPVGKGCRNCAAARDAVTLGNLAERQQGVQTAGCSQLRYSAAWAQKLPAAIPLYPQARVSEAAGSDAGACHIRVVSFSTAQPMQAIVDWYYTRAVRSGYSAEHQLDGDEHILGGARDKDGGAYVLFLNARKDGGTDVDLIANNGS